MSLQMDLVTKVKPGTVSTNFEEFKELVRKEMEDNFKTIVVTEDQLQSAKDARATLNKAKAALKDAVKSMQAENDEPLKTAKSQAKELEAILDDAISTLDSQIKTIENRQREQNMDKAMNVLASKLDRLSQDQNKFAVECMSWLQNPKWANKGTSFQSIMKECDEKVALIQQAWDLLEGDFRPQMLENFKQYGDLAKAQLYGKELERQRKAYLVFEPSAIGQSLHTDPELGIPQVIDSFPKFMSTHIRSMPTQ